MDKSKYQEIFEDSSRKIGEKIRYVAYGIIATDFGILTLKIEYFKNYLDSIKSLIIISIIISILGLAFDYLNSLFRWIDATRCIVKGKKSQIIIFFGYMFFFTKQLLILAAVTLLLIGMSKIGSSLSWR